MALLYRTSETLKLKASSFKSPTAEKVAAIKTLTVEELQQAVDALNTKVVAALSKTAPLGKEEVTIYGKFEITTEFCTLPIHNPGSEKPTQYFICKALSQFSFNSHGKRCNAKTD